MTPPVKPILDFHPGIHMGQNPDLLFTGSCSPPQFFGPLVFQKTSSHPGDCFPRTSSIRSASFLSLDPSRRPNAIIPLDFPLCRVSRVAQMSFLFPLFPHGHAQAVAIAGRGCVFLLFFLTGPTPPAQPPYQCYSFFFKKLEFVPSLFFSVSRKAKGFLLPDW